MNREEILAKKIDNAEKRLKENPTAKKHNIENEDQFRVCKSRKNN